MAASSEPPEDPRQLAAATKGLIDQLVQHVRADIHRCDAPKARALFETAAEVLLGLRTAFDHYETQDEAAMSEVPPGADLSPRTPKQENL